MQKVTTFIKHESIGGVLLVVATAFALLIDNSSLAHFYDSILTTKLSIYLGDFGLGKPLLLWINDGLMAIFFLLIGLEIKREVLQGELSNRAQLSLPILAAFGGIAVPALIFSFFNHDHDVYMSGWGIPIATDIAFALGVLMLLGKRVPAQLKILLLSIAIVDDLAAILVIAIFYTQDLSLYSIIFSGCGLCVAVMLNRFGVKRISAYMLIGVFIWVCVLKSGIHATLAGVLLAFCIPMDGKDPKDESPLETLEHSLHPWVTYMIMPLFAFANTGIHLGGINVDVFMTPLSLGIMCGLFFGKQIGVFGAIALGHIVGLCKKPAEISWMQIYGLSVLTGIGFTMSLFIAALAFDDPALGSPVRLSILMVSILSALWGYFILRIFTAKK